MIDGKAKLRQYDRYIERDGNFRQAWDTIAPYIAPTRSDTLIHGIRVPGTDQTRDLNDSTAVSACETGAAFIWGNVMNPATKWLGMASRDDKTAKLDEIREYTDEIIKIMLAAYNDSNFYHEGYESLIDLLGFGTCDLHIEERHVNKSKAPVMGFRGFVYRNYPIGTFTIDEDSNGEIVTRYVCYSQPGSALIDDFGLDGLSPQLAKDAKDNPEKHFEIVHCIEPRAYTEQKSKAARHMPYASYWVERATGHVCRESGYEEFPDAIARYAKTAGEVYGRGRGFIALPDIRSLQQLKYDSFESLEMAVKPPLMSALEEGSLGTIQLFPGGFNTVKLRPGMTDVRQAMAPLETGTKWDIVNLKEEELRASIERLFGVKHIRSILEAEKTQTFGEWAGKLALLNKLMGPVWGRMQKEFLNVINERCFNMLLRRGAFPPPPQVLLDQGAEFDWRYEGPLSKAQRSGEVESIMSYIQYGTIISQFQPDVVHRIDGDEAMKVLSDVLGVPGKVVRSDEQVEKIMEGIRQAREAETQKEDLMNATEAAKNLAPLANTVMQGQGTLQ